MNEKRVKVAIVGAGTAGMSSWREVSKYTDDFVLINGGAYGTTCARVGCMPSKLLIQAANDFHRRQQFAELGIKGAEGLQIDSAQVMKRVQDYRDRFVGGVLKSIDSIGDKNIRSYARFEEPGVLRINGGRIIAEKIIIAVGTRPFVPKAWEPLKEKIITTEEVFDLPALPEKMAVIGAGVIGLELGQALSRLGVQVKMFEALSKIGFFSDSKINDYAQKYFRQEFEEMRLGQMAKVSDADFADKVLMVAGREPNFDLLEFEKSGVELNEKGFPQIDPQTMRIKESDSLYIAGDISGDRQILHEAADEGRIAGFNAVQTEDKCFKRRCPLGIMFTDPSLAYVGTRYTDLKNENPIVGEVCFENQGRALIMAKNNGLIRIYGDRKEGKILGAEMMGPGVEHMAHLLAWAIQQQKTAFELLEFPFYHPVVEEGLRTAIRDMSQQVDGKRPNLEVPPCEPLDHE